MVRPYHLPLVGRRKYHELMKMLDNSFSIWLICELLNDNGVTRTEIGKTKVNIKLWLTWCVDVWPLLWVCDFLRRFHITQGLVICGCVRGLLRHQSCFRLGPTGGAIQVFLSRDLDIP